MDIKNANSHPIKVAKVDSSYSGPYANSHPFKVQDVGGGGGGAVSSVNGKTGDVVLNASDVNAATVADIDNRVKRNSGAPTTATVGTVGQLLEDTVNGELYQCTEIISSIGVDSDAGLTSLISNVTFPITNLTTLNSKISAVPSLVSGNTYMVRSMSGGGFYVSAVDDTTRLGVLTGVVAYQFPATLGVTPTPPTVWAQQIGRLSNTQPVFSFKTISSGQPSYVWKKVGISDFNDLENRPQLNGTAMTGGTNITNFVGTDGTNAGAQGLVPAPTTADADKFLKSDGTWATAGGGGPTVVQTTGNSTTDVMSQDATTKMIWQDVAAGLKVIRIGENNTDDYAFNTINIGAQYARSNDSVVIGSSATLYGSSSGSVVIGNHSHTPISGAAGSVAIGYQAGDNIDHAGMVDFGTTNTYYGYDSNSNYKVITGVHDAQNAHDAVTLGQLNALITELQNLGLNVSLQGASNSGNSGSSSSESTVICPSCQQETSAMSQFCEHCGYDLSSGGEEPGPEMPSDPSSEEPTIACPNCAQQIPESSTICPFCGYDMTSGSMTDPGGENAEEPSPEDPVAPEDAEAPAEG